MATVGAQDSILQGRLVLDLTDVKGYMCGKVLADLGADVIKIEPPGGDIGRLTSPFFHDDPHSEKSLPWLFCNMNKRGITLDISSPLSKDILIKLIQKAEFVIESFDPGYLDSIGFGYNEMVRINPKIILTSITPYGQNGPHSSHKTSDLINMARGGLMYMTGDPDRPPVRPGIPQSYLHGGVEGAAASMIAYYHREGTGESQHVDVSIQECVIWTNMDATGYWPLLGTYKRRNNMKNVNPNGVEMRSTWVCKDGFIVFAISGGAAVSQRRVAQGMVDWMESEGMASDFIKNINWATDYDRTSVAQDVVDKVEGNVQEFLLTKTKVELFAEGLKRQLRLGPATNGQDIAESEQLAAREYLIDVYHPYLEESIRLPGPFLRMSETPIVIHRSAPTIGEHNDEIYQNELSIDNSFLEELKKNLVI
jgi:crotonobetainyl-CoA:carnitine CoA-transferase CaiB-like acyl-CoA transferase